jgi:hypothetical protein
MSAGKGLLVIACFGLGAGLGYAQQAAIAASPPPSLPKITLQICRMAGLGSDAPGPLMIPSGTRFDDKDTALLAQPELGDSGPTNVSNGAPVILITSAALTLPQSRYCADVAAEPAAGTSDKALAAASGRLFAVAGKDDVALLGEVYATFKRGRQADAPANRPSR